MIRRKYISWLCPLLTIFLVGCGTKKEEGTVREQPEIPEQTEEKQEAPTRLLLSEEALEYMYQDGRPNGFDFGGVEENGHFYYAFTRPEEPDFYLRISDDFETATVRYNGRTMKLHDRLNASGYAWGWNISAGYGGAVSGYGMPFWADMTGDGQPDLLYLQGGGGTGMHEDWCAAYDLAAMEEIPILEPWEEMAAFITIEALGEEDGYIRCLVTDDEGRTYDACIAAGYEEENIWQEFRYTPQKSGWTTLDIDAEAGTLSAAMAFGMEDPCFGAFRYMGELTTELAYDTEQGAIVRSAPITVTVYPPDKV